jgi:hypothetical protein
MHCQGQFVGCDPAMLEQGTPNGLDLLSKANRLLASTDAAEARTT